MRQGTYTKKLRCAQVLLALVATVNMCSVWAEQKALMAFDSFGHRVHRVMQNPTREANPVLSQRRNAFGKSRVNSLSATVTWYDIAGNVVKIAYFDDPRVTHAPLTGASPRPDWLVLTQGAYLLEGPDSAAQLQLELPPRLSLGLVAEKWLLNLSE